MKTILKNMLLWVLKNVLTKELFEQIRNAVASGLFDAIRDIVGIYMDTTLSGSEKKAAVKAELKELKGELAEVLKQTSEGVLNTLIEAAVLLSKSIGKK